MTTTPPSDPGPSSGEARLRFELDVQPETTLLPWHAWLHGRGTLAQTRADFDSPLALLRFLANLRARQPQGPGPGGLR